MQRIDSWRLSVKDINAEGRVEKKMYARTLEDRIE